MALNDKNISLICFYLGSHGGSGEEFVGRHDQGSQLGIGYLSECLSTPAALPALLDSSFSLHCNPVEVGPAVAVTSGLDILTRSGLGKPLLH